MAKGKGADGSICAVYARYSSHNQNDASIEQQIAECREYAQAHNLKITSIYADRAVSGKSDRRPEFQKMIRHAEARRFQVVLTYKSNRIARNLLDALRYEERLSRAGVRVVYCKENFGDNAAGRLALRMMMSLNEFYSENMAEDIRRGMIDSAKQGKILGPIPLGYKKGADGRFEIDPDRAETVREIFSRVAHGETLASIADDLNARGIPTGYNKPWGRSSFGTLLSNERYVGVYIFADVRIEGGMPPIIDKQLFDIVQEKVRGRQIVKGRRRDHSEYLLTGKAFCAKCGAPMVGISGTSRNGEAHHYYVCKTKREQHACDKSNVRRDSVEREVARRIREIVLQPDVIEWMIDNVLRYQEEARRQSDLATYQARLTEVQRGIDHLVDAVQAGIFNESTKDRLDGLEAERRELRDLIASEQVKVKTVTREQIQFYLESFRDGDIEDRAYLKRLIQTFLVRVYLDDDKFRIVYNYSDDLSTLEYALSLDDLGAFYDPENPDAAGDPECSFIAQYEPPQPAEANTPWSIMMLNGVFVLSIFDRIV